MLAFDSPGGGIGSGQKLALSHQKQKHDRERGKDDGGTESRPVGSVGSEKRGQPNFNRLNTGALGHNVRPEEAIPRPQEHVQCNGD